MLFLDRWHPVLPSAIRDKLVSRVISYGVHRSCSALCQSQKNHLPNHLLQRPSPWSLEKSASSIFSQAHSDAYTYIQEKWPWRPILGFERDDPAEPLSWGLLHLYLRADLQQSINSHSKKNICLKSAAMSLGLKDIDVEC